MEILKGMSRIIKEKHPYITIEVGDIIESVPTSKLCIKYLLDRNYKVYEFKNDKMMPHILKNSYKYDNLFFKYEK